MAPDAPVAVVELTLPSDPRYLALVRVVMGATAGAIPSLSDARIADLKLVVTELFANAMEANWRSARIRRSEECGGGHDGTGASGKTAAGGPGEPDAAPVRVTCRADADRVTVTVADSAPGLDGFNEPHPPVGDPGRLTHERGLGIPLIQYLADQVDYVSGGDGTLATAVIVDRGEGRPRS